MKRPSKRSSELIWLTHFRSSEADRATPCRLVKRSSSPFTKFNLVDNLDALLSETIDSIVSISCGQMKRKRRGSARLSSKYHSVYLEHLLPASRTGGRTIEFEGMAAQCECCSAGHCFCSSSSNLARLFAAIGGHLKIFTPRRLFSIHTSQTKPKNMLISGRWTRTMFCFFGDFKNSEYWGVIISRWRFFFADRTPDEEVLRNGLLALSAF